MATIDEIYEQDFKFERKIREGLMKDFSGVQSSNEHKIFAQLWECFAWAAVIGFIHNKRLALIPPIYDRPFSLTTMKNNDGEIIAQALICLAVEKSELGLDILKSPEDVRIIIEEYANGGFYHVQQLIDNEQYDFSNFDKFKQEILKRNIANIDA